MHLDGALARQIAYSEQLPVFEQAVLEGIKPTFAVRVLLSTLRELARDGIMVDALSEGEILAVLHAVEDGKVAKEVVPEVLSAMAGGMSITDAIEQIAPPITEKELTAIIDKILQERSDFVRERGMGALGPIMGVVMKEARGRVDGKVIADLVRKELETML
jgi:glutamyl-tRNA(Gln) amidotransferase subunit E